MIKKRYDCKKRRRCCAAILLLLALLMSGCAQETPASGSTDPLNLPSSSQQPDADSSAGQQAMGNDTLEDGTYLFTVDGYGVTEAEFLLFLRDQKAVATNYFWTNYELQPDADFWDAEVNGENPLRFAKERALAAAIKAKEEFILAAERGILAYQDFNGMMTDMEAENADRFSKKETGETFYGVSEFTPFTYYQYLNGNVRAELEKSQEKLANPTEEQLRAVYELNKENFTRGVVYNYKVTYADGRTEEISQNTREINKADTLTEDLIYEYFSSMQPGDTIEDYAYYDEKADITLQSVEDLGYQSLEESEESLRVFFARIELSELIASRVRTAEVVFDQSRYDALEMP